MADGERVPNEIRARALAEVALGREKPRAIAARYGVTPAQLGVWRRSLATDLELQLATSAALAVMTQAWLPALERVITKFCASIERDLDERPHEIETAEKVGAVRALAEVAGQAAALRSRVADDDEPVRRPALRDRMEDLDS